MASSDKVFGLQASRPSKLTLLASAFTGHPIGFAAPRSRTGRQRVEVCSLLPQRDCCRLSQHSLYSATKREGRWASPEFKEPAVRLANRSIPSNERSPLEALNLTQFIQERSEARALQKGEVRSAVTFSPARLPPLRELLRYVSLACFFTPQRKSNIALRKFRN